MTKKFNLTIEILHEYMEHIRTETYIPKTSIYEYILENYSKYGINPYNQFRIHLKNVDFSNEENGIDLSGANLSGVKFNNVIFSGKYLRIKDANLIGCRFENSRFTDQISLKGTQFGPIDLDHNLFENADLLNESKYDPTNPNALMLPITKQCLEEYLATDNPKDNLNNYINGRFSHRYKGRPLIADLSGLIIDSKFNEADISGSNLTNSTITGTIENLVIRDCITCNTTFENCHLISPDLRGTSLANQGILLRNGFNPTNFGQDVIFESPKLSLNQNLTKLDGYSITLSQETEDIETFQTIRSKGVEMQGNPYFDPCYNREQPDINRTLYKFSKSDLDLYASYTKITRVEKDDFLTFIKREKAIAEDNIFGDFSGLDLNGADLSLGHFKHCDFSFTKLNGCNFRNSLLEHCNFTRSTSSISFLTSQKSIAYQAGQWVRSILPTNSYFPPDVPIRMNGATLRNCDLTWADLTKAHGEGVIFDNVTAINLNAPNLEFTREKVGDKTKSSIQGSNLSGAFLNGLRLDESLIDHSNLTEAQVSGAHIHKSEVTRSNITKANLSRSQITEGTFTQINSDSHSNFSHVTITQSDLSKTKLAGKITGMKVDAKTKTDDTDLSGVQVGREPLGELNLNLCINGDNKHIIQVNQAQEKIDYNRKKFYNRVGIAALICIVVVSAVFPPLLGATLPAALAVVAMPTIINVATIGACVIGIPIAMELMIRNFTPQIISSPVSNVINKLDHLWKRMWKQPENIENQSYSGPSIIRPMANLFGAERIINLQNKQHIQKRSHHQNILQQRITQRAQVIEQENVIQARAIQKDKDIAIIRAQQQTLPTTPQQQPQAPMPQQTETAIHNLSQKKDFLSKFGKHLGFSRQQRTNSSDSTNSSITTASVESRNSLRSRIDSQ